MNTTSEMNRNINEFAMRTANSAFLYAKIMDGKPLSVWVELVHKYISKVQGWEYKPLRPGAFGFDNFCMSIGRLLEWIEQNPPPKKTLKEVVEDCANIIHEGWVENYIYWRDNNPQFPFQRPTKPLGDKRRDLCAQTSFNDLCQEEKEKDILIAKSVIILTQQ